MKIVGHRGANGLAPPNTEKGIRLAARHGVDGIELDVQRTKDGVHVLFHDPILDIATNSHGTVEWTNSERVLNAKIDGEDILTLEDGLELASELGLFVLLEYKSERPDHNHVKNLLRKHDLYEESYVVSFHSTVLREVEHPRKIHIGRTPLAPLRSKQISKYADGVGTHYTPAVSSALKTARACDMETVLWSLYENELIISEAIDLQPDYLITNRPDLVSNELNDSAGTSQTTSTSNP